MIQNLYRLQSLGRCRRLNARHCCVIFVLFWTSTLHAEEVHRRRTTGQVTELVDQATASDLIVTDLRVYTRRKQIVFDVTLDENTTVAPWLILINMSDDQYQQASAQYDSEGFERTVYRTISVSGQTLHSAVWTRAASSFRPLVLPERTVPPTGFADPVMAPLDRLMEDFLKQHNVAGATLAIAQDDRMIYSRGFGFADAAAETVMHPDAKMRIASISKPITAVAILMLAQQGKLQLDDAVLPILQKGGYPQLKSDADVRWNDITIRHLLHHTGGWDRDAGTDPMFQVTTITRQLDLKRTAGAEHVIRYLLTQPLDFDPGTRHSYSNFGYCVLGRVIEVVTGENYNDYVRRTILQPAAMTNTMPGKTRLDDRVDGEVRYHMQKQTSAPAFWSIVSRSLRSNSGKLPNSVPSQYGQWDLEIMDAHGGWLSTAPDLLRFVIAAHSSEAGLLSQTSQQTMLERPDLPDNPGSGFWYGCGWQVRPVGGYGFNIWHSGALDGTSALLVRRWDNMTWAVLFNTDRSTNGEFLASLIDPRLHHAISQVDQLPEYNLFTAEENPGSQD